MSHRRFSDARVLSPLDVVGRALIGLGFLTLTAVAVLAMGTSITERNTHASLELAVVRDSVSRVAVIVGLDRAIAAAEQDGLTSGTTAVHHPQPIEDVGLWYQGLRDARDAALSLPSGAPQHDQQALLTVVRSYRTAPSGINFFPYNRQAGWALIGGVVAVVAGLLVAARTVIREFLFD